MQEQLASITTQERSAPKELDTPFGIPESLRNLICAGLIAGSAFIAGCAKSLEERSATIDNLASPPISTLINNPKWFDGTEIAVRGTPRFVSDLSFSEIEDIPVYLGGDSFTAVPIPVEYKRLVYQLHDQDGTATGIYINSKQELPESTLKISATVRQQQNRAVLEVQDFVPVTQGALALE